MGIENRCLERCTLVSLISLSVCTSEFWEEMSVAVSSESLLESFPIKSGFFWISSSSRSVRICRKMIISESPFSRFKLVFSFLGFGVNWFLENLISEELIETSNMQVSTLSTGPQNSLIRQKFSSTILSRKPTSILISESFKGIFFLMDCRLPEC